MACSVFGAGADNQKRSTPNPLFDPHALLATARCRSVPRTDHTTATCGEPAEQSKRGGCPKEQVLLNAYFMDSFVFAITDSIITSPHLNAQKRAYLLPRVR